MDDLKRLIEEVEQTLDKIMQDKCTPMDVASGASREQREKAYGPDVANLWEALEEKPLSKREKYLITGGISVIVARLTQYLPRTATIAVIEDTTKYLFSELGVQTLFESSAIVGYKTLQSLEEQEKKENGDKLRPIN